MPKMTIGFHVLVILKPVIHIGYPTFFEVEVIWQELAKHLHYCKCHAPMI